MEKKKRPNHSDHRTTIDCKNCRLVLQDIRDGKYSQVRIGIDREPLEGKFSLLENIDLNPSPPVRHTLLSGGNIIISACELPTWRTVSTVENAVIVTRSIIRRRIRSKLPNR